MTFVLDSWAWLAWFQNEPPADQVDDLLNQSDDRLVMAEMNAGEVYYIVKKKHSQQKAQEAKAAIGASPVKVMNVTSHWLWSAVELKSDYSISFADAFAGALALDHGATLVTGDDEFKALQNGEGLNVLWL